MMNEIIVAIDPFLSKVEYIILWKNKLKSCAVFTLCHALFWLFLNYNIRTYCTVSCILLTFHLLDMYRAKKRRDLMKLHKSNQNITETGTENTSELNPKSPSLLNNITSTGKFLIYFNSKMCVVYNKLLRLKRRNKLLYFLVMFSFWSVTAVIGSRIKGFYLVYIVFWIIFFLPAIIHFDIPKKLLSRALPLLEQLDHSMKYERRSVLDKSELLVDVKHKTSDEDDQNEEDEYLKSFELGILSKSKRRIIENLEDEESLFSDHTEDDHTEDDNDAETGEDDDEEIVEEIYEVETYGSKNNEQFQVKKMISKTSNKDKAPVKTSNVHLDLLDINNDSLLPDEFMPNVNMSALNNSLLQTSNDESLILNNTRNHFHQAARNNYDSPNKVLKHRRPKERPNILNYYSNSATSSKRTPQNERDIDETFDFLDEELDKY